MLKKTKHNNVREVTVFVWLDYLQANRTVGHRRRLHKRMVIKSKNVAVDLNAKLNLMTCGVVVTSSRPQILAQILFRRKCLRLRSFIGKANSQKKKERESGLKRQVKGVIMCSSWLAYRLG